MIVDGKQGLTSTGAEGQLRVPCNRRCLCLRVSGSATRAGDQTSPATGAEPDKCKAVGVGVIQQPEGYHSEKDKGTGRFPIIYGIDSSLHPKLKRH